MNQQRLYARDAYGSATQLSLLLAVVMVIAMATSRGWELGPALEWSRVFLLMLAVGSLGYLFGTWQRPSVRTALTITLGLILPIFPYVGLAATRWQAVGRPWELFPGLHVALVSMAFIVPRYFWLGMSLVLAFTVEAVGLTFWMRANSQGVAAVPSTEPLLTLVVSAVSIGLLWMREQRRRLTVRYLAAASEAAMLEKTRNTFRDASAGFRRSARKLLEGARALQDTEGGAVALPMQSAISRLDALSDRLRALDVSPGEQPAPDGAAGADADTAERAFRAHDAIASVRLLSIIIVVAAALAVVGVWNLEVGLGATLFGGTACLALLIFAATLHDRAHPSERRATILFLVLQPPIFALFAYMHVRWAHLTGPVEVFTGTKVAMALMALVVPRSRWLGIAVVVLLGVEALVLYQVLGFAEQKDHIALSEPWITLVYCAIGVGLVVLSDERRTASVRLLRAEVERAALARRSAVLLAILDETGSPLQVLALTVSLLEKRTPTSATVAEMRLALADLATARHQITDASLLHQEGSLAFDSTRVLRPPNEPS